MKRLVTLSAPLFVLSLLLSAGGAAHAAAFNQGAGLTKRSQDHDRRSPTQYIYYIPDAFSGDPGGESPANSTATSPSSPNTMAVDNGTSDLASNGFTASTPPVDGENSGTSASDLSGGDRSDGSAASSTTSNPLGSGSDSSDGSSDGGITLPSDPPPASPVTPVPLPSSAPLFGGALLALGILGATWRTRARSRSI